MFLRTLLLPAVFWSFAVTVTAGDWPQWRGSNRDNHVVGFKAPSAWPKELTKKWKVEVGDGLASPALVGEKVFVFTRQGDEEVTLCLDAGSGKEVWKDEYEAVKVTGPAAGFKGPDKFTGPRSSPAVGDGKVCTFGVGGVVSCLNASDGKVAWRKDTKARPMFFTATSPVIEGGLCIVHTGERSRGQLTAYDLATGDEKWKWSGDAPSYGSPVVATLGGIKQVVEMSDKGLVGVALADGKELWQYALSTRYQTGTPVIDKDVVICIGTAVAIEKKGDGLVAKMIWKGQMPHQYNTPVLKDGRLYGLMGTGQTTKIYCQDAKTGKTLWEDTTSRGQCGYILDAGSVMVELSSDSNLVVFKPDAKDFTEVAKYKVADTGTWASPILDGKRVFVKDRDSLILWTVE